MKVVHSVYGKSIEKEIRDDISIITTNKIGGFIHLSIRPLSRYQGIFFSEDGDMYKVIEDIAPLNTSQVTKLKNKLFSFERIRGSLTESFFMPYGYNALVYELNQREIVELLLDVKKPYDNSEFGRNYNVFFEKGMIIVEFTKKYKLYIAIKEDSFDYSLTNEWIKLSYDFDKNRNSEPSERYVYKALKLHAKKIVIAVSKDKKEAIKQAKYVFTNAAKLKSFKEKLLRRLLDSKDDIAYACAKVSMYNLVNIVEDEAGIFAGLPWFFQFWKRDELISLNAIFYEDDFLIAKSILSNNLKYIDHYASIETKPGTSLRSADAVGWVFKRYSDLFNYLKQKRMFKKYFSKKEINGITEKLRLVCENLLNYHTEDNLATNHDKETWMDTLPRNGARIEIQALRLLCYEFLCNLTNDYKYKNLEHELKHSVRNKFLNDSIFADGLGDFTIRPNIFIAYYIYPKLLKKDEWKQCFDKALSRLWCEWGGLSTIDKASNLFISEHSGEDSRSYHNGDSWFWVNNIAAIALNDIDKEHFKEYIDKILKASTEEILWKGAIGSHSELSSANSLKAEGCLCQAWSLATYIELVHILNSG